MTAMFIAASISAVVLWIFLRGRSGPSLGAWSRAIEFKPRETMAPEQLFGCLLSGNFALLMRDNFNQLGSALSVRRIGQIMREHWGIESQDDCLQAIQSRLAGLGWMSPSEKRAIAAWLCGESIDTNAYAALEDTCTFMASRARIAQIDELRRSRLSVLGWDVQQLAYLVRLACTVGHISRASAEEILALLGDRARLHYASWKDFSLGALLGLGLRGSLGFFDRTEWTQFARTHSVLMNPQRSPIRSASRWGERVPDRTLPRSARDPGHGGFPALARGLA